MQKTEEGFPFKVPDSPFRATNQILKSPKRESLKFRNLCSNNEDSLDNFSNELKIKNFNEADLSNVSPTTTRKINDYSSYHYFVAEKKARSYDLLNFYLNK